MQASMVCTCSFNSIICFQLINMSCVILTCSVPFRETDKKPFFITPLPEEVEVLEGDSTRIECRVGPPGADVFWYKDDEPLEEDDRVTIETEGDVFAVVISPTELDDEAEYKCFAQNEFGKVTCQAELIVEEGVSMPLIKEPLKNLEANVGDVIRFDVRITGDPEPVVEWFKDGHLLEDEGRVVIVDDVDDNDKELFALVIEDCQVVDSGSYKVVAMSEAGTADSQCDLVVTRSTVPPEFKDEMEEVSKMHLMFILSHCEQVST